MRILDKILVQLRDAKWHNLDEINKGIYLPSDKLNELFCFLENQALVIINKEKIRITGLGLKFLDL
jgi:predicted transcriptional regulator